MFKVLKEINYILNKRDKIFICFLFIVILGSALLDLVGVAAILPIVDILTVPADKVIDAINNNSFLHLFATIFNVWDRNTLVLITLGFFCLLFLIKAAYGFLYTYVMNRFSLNYSRKLTKRLMEAYLYFPYEFHLNNNTSTLIRKCTYDVDMFKSTINDLLNFLVKSITSLSILIFLLIVDWMIALIAGGVVCVFGLLLVFVLKPKAKVYSKEAQRLNSFHYKYLSQAFRGIKESKISNTEKYFINEFDRNKKEMNNIYIKRNLLNGVPTHCIELVGMLGISLSLVVILLVNNTETSSIVSKFAVFAYAVIKLLPAITTVTTVLNNINFYKVSVDSLVNDIKIGEETTKEESDSNFVPLEFKNEIALNNVVFAYETLPDRKILNNVSVKIYKNTSVAFCGNSGAGKTTLIDVILGLLKCKEGCVTCDGVDIKTNIRGWRRNIAYIPQTIYLCDDSIRKNVAFGIKDKLIDDTKIWDALEKAQLKEYVENLPEKLDTVIGEAGVRMSGGQRQRIGIARAFYRDTNIVVFDEATSALDYETEKQILDHVSQYSKDHTLIIITHRLNTIDSCDKIYKVEGGSVTTVK